jgi:hypothetical protein
LGRDSCSQVFSGCSKRYLLYLLFQSDPRWIALVSTIPTRLQLLLVCTSLNQSHSSSTTLDAEPLDHHLSLSFDHFQSLLRGCGKSVIKVKMEPSESLSSRRYDEAPHQ